MDKSRDFLFSLIKCSLSGRHIPDLDDFHLEDVMNLSIQQGISTLAFDGYQKVYDKVHNSRSNGAKIQWIGLCVQAESTMSHILEVQKLISCKLGNDGIKALVLKGSALSRYYPTPTYRQFGDIDIYSPTEFEKIEEILKGLATEYDLECYRHSQCQIQGVTIENHIYLTDARWKKKWGDLESKLSNMAAQDLQRQNKLGLSYPGDLFTILFFIYHALAHFVYEQLTVRFLVDLYFLINNRKDVDDAMLEAEIEKYGLMPITGALTALCIKRLGLNETVVSEGILQAAKTMDSSLLNRFEDDMFSTDHEGFTSSSLKDRIARILTFYQNRWKIVEFMGILFYRFILSKVSAIIKWR